MLSGYGAFTEKFFRKGDFLVEYVGELISYEEALYREIHYKPSMGSFLFFFKYGAKRQWWVLKMYLWLMLKLDSISQNECY